MKANKTYSAFIELNPTQLAQCITLNLRLIGLWNMLKAVIDRRLANQQLLQEELATKPSDSRLVEIAQFQKENGISPISLNYLLPDILSKMKELGHPLTTDLARQLAKKISGSYLSYFALKKNKDHRARIPKEKNRDTDFVVLSWSSMKMRGNTITLSLPEKERLEIELPKNILERAGANPKLCYVTLVKIPQDNRWKVGIVTSYEAPTPTETPTRIRAIDLGSGYIAVTNSDGTEHLIPTRRGEKHWMKEIARVESRLDKRTKGSIGYTKLMMARRKMHNKANFQHVDHQRKLAHALCGTTVDMIVVGKTRTRLGLARRKESTPEQHHGVQNTGNMGRLKTFLEEKCVERGIIYLELPDPSREGVLTDPNSKFLASRKLLGLVSKSPHTEYTQKKFRFNQGGKRARS